GGPDRLGYGSRPTCRSAPTAFGRLRLRSGSRGGHPSRSKKSSGSHFKIGGFRAWITRSSRGCGREADVPDRPRRIPASLALRFRVHSQAGRPTAPGLWGLSRVSHGPDRPTLGRRLEGPAGASDRDRLRLAFRKLFRPGRADLFPGSRLAAPSTN